jgi:hypothetical protein
MLKLQISDQTFTVAESEFFAFLRIGEDGWQTHWSMDFKCEAREVCDAEWAPSLAGHAFDPVLPALEQLSGIEIELQDTEDGEPQFWLCVFEHEAVTGGRLTLGRWNGTSIEVKLTGLAAVGFNDQYGDNLPLHLEGDLPFRGVVVDEHHFDQAEQKLSRFFDRALFGAPERHSNGGVIFQPNHAAWAEAR